MKLTVYIPANTEAEALLGIKPGSAIVSTAAPSGEHVMIDYEGGLYGQEGSELFRWLVRHAADRHVSRYPRWRASWLKPTCCSPWGGTPSRTTWW